MGAHQDQFVSFAKYNRLFNRQLYTVVSTLSDEQRKKDMGAFFGSIHRTLNHILLADRIWLARFRQALPEFSALANAKLIVKFESLGQELYANFDELTAERQETDTVIVDWAAELTEERLARSMKYRNAKGEARENAVWLSAAHLFNHQAHHRGQVTTLLAQLGIDPGVTDLVAHVAWAKT